MPWRDNEVLPINSMIYRSNHDWCTLRAHIWSNETNSCSELYPKIWGRTCKLFDSWNNKDVLVIFTFFSPTQWKYKVIISFRYGWICFMNILACFKEQVSNP